MSGNASAQPSFDVSVYFSRSRYQASASTAAMTTIEPSSFCLSAPKSMSISPSGQAVALGLPDFVDEVLVAGEDDDEHEISDER